MFPALSRSSSWHLLFVLVPFCGPLAFEKSPLVANEVREQTAGPAFLVYYGPAFLQRRASNPSREPRESPRRSMNFDETDRSGTERCLEQGARSPRKGNEEEACSDFSANSFGREVESIAQSFQKDS